MGAFTVHLLVACGLLNAEWSCGNTTHCDWETFNDFFNIVNKYLKENKDNDKLIGVHCTHGLNRAGYMVCRYMIHQLGIPPDQAIADFNSARGHAQEREEYLKDLREAPWIDEVVAIDPNASEDKKPTTPSYTRGRTSTNESVSYDDGEYTISPPTWSTGPVRRWSNSPATPEGGAGWRESRRRSNNPYSTSRPQRQYSQDNRQPRHIEQHSPYEGQRYYDSRYQGRVAPQYRHDFYQQRGSGFGPQRTQTRWASKAYQEQQSSSYRPRQYRGPRPYCSPERRNEEEATPETPQEKQRDDYSSTPQHQPRRSLRNHVFTPEENKRQPFSPGDRENVFTPDNSSRRRSARWNPY